MTRFATAFALLTAVVVVAAPVPKDSPRVTVRGRVAWPKDSPVPRPKGIDVSTDQDVCCKDGPLLSSERLIDPKSRGVANVVVWLRPDTDDRKATFPTDRIHPDWRKPKPVTHVVTMPKCQFSPRVFAARAGDRLAFVHE